MSATEIGPEAIKVEGPDKREYEVWFYKKLSELPADGATANDVLYDVTARVLDAQRFEKQFDVITHAAEDDVDKVWSDVAGKAKELVESAPKPVLEHVSKEDADKAKEQLEGAGAKVDLK